MTQTISIQTVIFCVVLIVDACLYCRFDKQSRAENKALRNELDLADKKYITKAEEYSRLEQLNNGLTETIRQQQIALDEAEALGKALAEWESPFDEWLRSKVEKGENMPLKGLTLKEAEEIIKSDHTAQFKGGIGGRQIVGLKDGELAWLHIDVDYDPNYEGFFNQPVFDQIAGNLIKPAQLSFTDLWQSYLDFPVNQDTKMDSRTFGLLLHQKGIKSKKVKGKGTMYQGVKWRT